MKHNKYINSVLQIQNMTNFFVINKNNLNQGHHKSLAIGLKYE